MINRLLKLTLSLAFFRAGPQDMPYSVQLTRVLAALSAAASALLMSPALPLPLAIASGIGGVAGIAFFTQVLLRARQLESRLAQTLAAQFAVGLLFALLLYPAFETIVPHAMDILKAASQPPTGAAASAAATAEPPQALPGVVMASLYADVVFIWSLVVSVRINRAAAELTSSMSWLLTLASLFVVMSFITMAQIFVFPFAR